MKTNIIVIIAIILAVIGFVIFQSSDMPKPAIVIQSYADCARAGYPIQESYPETCSTPDGQTFTNTTPTTPTNTAIIINSPQEGETISSGFVATGKAHGTWYFEGSFPVKLYDANNKLLVETYAQAQGEWMTEDSVPFKSQPLIFSSPTKTGTLVFQMDNPSGLPEYDNEIRFPVMLSTAERSVNLYYYNSAKDSDVGGNPRCSKAGIEAVQKTMPLTQTPIQEAIRLLLKTNETATEASNGLSTEFPLSGVELTGASLSGSTLTLTFKDPENKTSGGSCRVGIMRAQIEATAKQFPEVKTVRIAPTTVYQP